MKKIFALVLALCMVLSLAACGGGQGGGANAGNVSAGFSAEDAFDTDAFIATIPKELEGTTVTFLNWYKVADRQAEYDNVKAFEAASGIKVNLIDAEYGKAYADKLAGLVATGDAPDVIRMSKPNISWMKMLQPITNSGYDFSAPEWNSSVKEMYSVDGYQYAANLTYTPFVVFSLMQYYTDDMEEYGYEDPLALWKKGEWTWEKLEDMCDEWIKQGAGYHGVGTASYSMVANTVGKDFVAYDGKQWQMNLYDSELLDIWRHTLEQKESRIFVQTTNTTFGLTNHKAMFATVDSTSLEASSQYGDKMKNRGVWGVVPLPTYKDYEYHVPTSELIGWGMPIGAKNPKAVPYFIAWYANLAKYDMDSFFYDERCKEIFIDLTSRPNRFTGMSSAMFSFDANPFVWHLFNNAASSQITTFIQQQEYRCQDKLNQWNDAFANMNKEVK